MIDGKLNLVCNNVNKQSLMKHSSTSQAKNIENHRIIAKGDELMTSTPPLFVSMLWHHYYVAACFGESLHNRSQAGMM